MRGIELEKGGACLYRGNDERIDPDTDFPHIDKRIQDVLGQYQKDFMGEFSADTLGPRFGGYGSFLPVDRYYPVPTLTRSQAHISSRSPHNPTKEVRQNPTIQANESISVRPRPCIPPLSGQATSALDNTVDVRSAGDAFLNNQPKTVPAYLSDDNLLKVRPKVGSGYVRDNSAIYTGLGLEMSPSSSLGDSPLDSSGTLHSLQALPEESPSYIIKVMTSLPVPGSILLTPLSKSLVSLKEKEIILEENLPRLDTDVKLEHESISSEVKTTMLKERKEKQSYRNKASEFEKRTGDDPTSITGHCSKRMEVSKMSDVKETVIENPASTNGMHLDKKGTSTIIKKDNVSRTSFPLSERSGVAQLVDVGTKIQKQSHVKQEPAAQLVDVGTKFQKQSHVKQEPALEYVDSLAFPGASFEQKVNSPAFSEKIQRDKNVSSLSKSDAGNDKLSQTGYVEHNSKKSKELKKKVKEELQDSFSSRDVGIQHMTLTHEDSDKSSKQQRKMKNKVKVLPESTFQEAGAYHEQTDRSMEKIHNGRKPSSTVEKGFKDRTQKNEELDFLHGMKDLGGATSESLEESSSAKNLPRSQMRANVNNRKDRVSSEGKKKTRKSREGSQSSVALPKVSFRVGSSSTLSQPTDCRSDFVSHGKTQKEPRKVKGQSSDVAGKATLKKEEKMTATKDSIIGVAKREKYALSSKLKDKSDSNQYQYPSNPRADPTDMTHLMEKAPASAEIPSVVIQEDWVECDKCQTWRLLPHHIKPDDLPKRWLCSMLNWLPGMNKCSFTEEETRDALRALYQLPPAVNDAQIHQTYPNEGPPVALAAGNQPAGISSIPVTGLDGVPNARKREPKQEVHAKSKMDQLRTVESGNKQNSNQSRSGASKQGVLGKKREGSKDARGALKKVKSDSQQFAKDRSSVVPSGTEIGNASLNCDLSAEISKDLVMENSNISSKQLKDKSHYSVTNEERKDIPAKKRKLKDWNNGPVGTELPSSEVPFKEKDNDLRKEKRQKLEESNLQEKESSTTRPNDKNDGGNQGNVSHGGSSRKTGRRDDRSSEQHHHRNASHKTVEKDGKKSSRSDPELKMPALTAATSSSSKISSTCRVKVKSQAKCSPVGSISSSSMKVSRSDHDRTRDQGSTPSTKRELSMVKKKNLEAGIVAPDVTHHFEERAEGKSKKGTDAEVPFHPVQEVAVAKKISAVKHVDGHRKAKQIGTKFTEEDDSSRRKIAPIDQGARSVNIAGLEKFNSEYMVPETVKRKHDQAGSSRDKPPSSTQVLVDVEKVDEFNAMVADNSKGKLPKEPGCGKLVADCVGASSSVIKDNPDLAARTALREATDLKHSANRLRTSGPGVSTQIFFQAALKFLQGASLLEPDNPGGSRCGDMNSSQVYSSTAKLCLFCAHEFEKLNDMASAALAFKCMEVAYMRVVYASDVPSSRDRQELQLAQAEVHQVVESPSSSASDVDNVNNLTPNDAAVRATQSAAVHGSHVISAGNRPNFVRLLNFAEDVNLAMDASRRSQNAFAAARSTLTETGNGEGMSAIKRVLDFSFHDVNEFLHLVRLAME